MVTMLTLVDTLQLCARELRDFYNVGESEALRVATEAINKYKNNEITVLVAWGEINARVAEEKDPEGENPDLYNEDEGVDVWDIYTFKTMEEANAFKLGVAESNGWLESYWTDGKQVEEEVV